ncbi:CIR protein PIR protein [Plasmodium vinckei vinckei]|uniref:CIR protein PIR protein n=1 Tax=Plasmodium vinckei vinckei TaxID=54757 RepID=A0A449BT63_PLAVN|nr:CIR protein PIR protein [Plasmodium vinckei vinckei]VEV56666.1 CIR protein PIR protein [Plasmodium vinckei vinckei]
MAEKLCKFLLEVDGYFNNENVDEKKFNANSSFGYRCPYEKKGKKQIPRGCKNNYERINAVAGYLYQNLYQISNQLNNVGDHHSQYLEMFIMWLGDKLYKLEKGKDATIKESYEKHLKPFMSGFNYWNVLNNKRVYTEAKLWYMNEFYKLFNHICNLVIEYNKTHKNTDTSNLINYFMQCDKTYKALYNIVKDCKPYLHLLDILKKIYEDFRFDKIINDSTRPLLSNHFKSLRTGKNNDEYFVTQSKDLDFQHDGCVKREIPNDQNSKKGVTGGNIGGSQGNIKLPPVQNPAAAKKQPVPAQGQQGKTPGKPPPSQGQQGKPSGKPSGKPPRKPPGNPPVKPSPAQTGAPKPQTPSQSSSTSSQKGTSLNGSQTSGQLHQNGAGKGKGSKASDTGVSGSGGGSVTEGASGNKVPSVGGKSVTDNGGSGVIGAGKGGGDGNKVDTNSKKGVADGNIGGSQGNIKLPPAQTPDIKPNPPHTKHPAPVQPVSPQKSKGSVLSANVKQVSGDSPGGKPAPTPPPLQTSETNDQSGAKGSDIKKGNKVDGSNVPGGGISHPGSPDGKPKNGEQKKQNQVGTPSPGPKAGSQGSSGSQTKDSENSSPGSNGAGISQSPDTMPPPPTPQGGQKLGTGPQRGTKDSNKGLDPSKSEKNGAGIQKGNSDSVDTGKGVPSVDTGASGSGPGAGTRNTNRGSGGTYSQVLSPGSDQGVSNGGAEGSGDGPSVEKGDTGSGTTDGLGTSNTAQVNPSSVPGSSGGTSKDNSQTKISKVDDPSLTSQVTRPGNQGNVGGIPPSVQITGKDPPSIIDNGKGDTTDNTNTGDSEKKDSNSVTVNKGTTENNKIDQLKGTDHTQGSSSSVTGGSGSGPGAGTVGGSNSQVNTNVGKGGIQTLATTQVTLPSSDISPSNIGNGNKTLGTAIKVIEKLSIWCIAQNKKCNIVGIGIIGFSIFSFLAIMYKYLSFGSATKSKKKNMKRVIKLVDGNKKTKIIISSYDKKRGLKLIINSVGGKKYPLLNMYKLMQTDPMPFINLFFLLIFFVYKRKRDTIE